MNRIRRFLAAACSGSRSNSSISTSKYGASSDSGRVRFSRERTQAVMTGIPSSPGPFEEVLEAGHACAVALGVRAAGPTHGRSGDDRRGRSRCGGETGLRRDGEPGAARRASRGGGRDPSSASSILLDRPPTRSLGTSTQRARRNSPSDLAWGSVRVDDETPSPSRPWITKLRARRLGSS